MDYHLWQLVIDGRTYGLPDDEDWGTAPRKEAAKVRLRDVLKPGETVITYTYDFGDDWVHEIRIRDIRQGEPGVGYPRRKGSPSRSRCPTASQKPSSAMGRGSGRYCSTSPAMRSSSPMAAACAWLSLNARVRMTPWSSFSP